MSLRIGIATFEYDFGDGSGYVMGGYMARAKPSEGIHDPICFRGLYIENPKNDRKVLILSGDFVGLNLRRVHAVKNRISDKYNIPSENILITVIHTHSSVLNINLFSEPTPGVLDKIDEGIVECASKAISNSFEGYIELFKGNIEGVSFNRRDWDEKSELINTNTVALKLYDDNGTLKGIVYNYSCHPVVMGPENLLLSADWPYFTQQYLRERLHDPQLFVMYLQGTQGNLNPRNVPMSGSKEPNTFDDCREIGEDVGKQLLEIISSNKAFRIPGKDMPIENIILKGIIEPIEIVIDDEDKVEEFGKYTQIVGKEGEFYVQTEVQGIQIGPLGIIGFPGEMFSHIGIEVINASKMPFQMVLGFTNDYIGYAAPEEIYLIGGYEMLMMSLSPQEGSVLVNAAKKILSHFTA